MIPNEIQKEIAASQRAWEEGVARCEATTGHNYNADCVCKNCDWIDWPARKKKGLPDKCWIPSAMENE